MSKFEETPQWQSGSSVADFLDAYFRAKGWQIEPTTPHEERKLCLGDRHFRRDGQHLLVEYKSGIQSHYTGNIFLETVSVDTQNKPGWVYTCKADVIFYAALLDKRILVFVPETLRLNIETLKTRFKEVATGKGQNKGYNTHGVLVPMTHAENYLARQVIHL